MDDNIQIRALRDTDPKLINTAFNDQGWDKPETLYQQYLQYQESGVRDVLVAEWKGKFAGYLTIKWQSDNVDFKEKGIPEIVDLNVLMKYRRKGIASFLMEVAEKRIAKKSTKAGIGFGLYADYGNAQILYIKRGYIPNGKGISRNGQIMKYGDEVKIDDSLVIHLTKQLK